MSHRAVCPVSGQEFEISDEDLNFYARVSPTVGGQKLLIPPPTLCPDERQRRRLAFRNERYLYRRDSILSGKPVVSVYSPDKPWKVCAKDEWLTVDNTDSGREFDFSRSFFDQFGELYQSTYKASIIQAGEMLNSEYTHFCGWLKNCYLIFDSGKSEDCMYGTFVAYSRNCFNCMYVSQCELCYDSVKLENCYQTFFSAYSKNCSSSAYLHSCIGCKNCLCCANLRNKEYYAFNQPVGAEQFKKLWAETFNGSHAAREALQKKFRELLITVPRKANTNVNCDNCSGDDLVRCENVIDSYNCIETKDCRYCYDLYLKTSDCYDVGTYGEQMQYCYEVGASGGTVGHSEVSNLFFSSYVYYGGSNIFYSSHCHEGCQDVFGCCDIRKKQYCILNKQYSKTEYERLVPKIFHHMRETGEWGEFFPMYLSLFGYNESLAAEFYPEDEAGVQRLGANWSSYSTQTSKVTSSIPATELPDSTHEAGDDILKTAILCSVTKKPFKILPLELKFYREQGLPLPRLHPEARLAAVQWMLNPRRLWKRSCGKCGVEIQSSFAPERAEKVHCEACYLECVN